MYRIEPKNPNSARELPSAEYLRECLAYNSETGALLWRRRPRSHFRNQAAYVSWNKRFPGSPALSATRNRGYLGGALCGVGYRQHRVIWKLVYDEEPDHIDHVNGVVSDNRLANLQSVSQKENLHNSAMSVRNTSGKTGVVWSKARRKWNARICTDTHYKSLGWYESFEEACAARRAGEILLGYHPNHGKERAASISAQTVAREKRPAPPKTPKRKNKIERVLDYLSDASPEWFPTLRLCEEMGIASRKSLHVQLHRIRPELPAGLILENRKFDGGAYRVIKSNDYSMRQANPERSPASSTQ